MSEETSIQEIGNLTIYLDLVIIKIDNIKIQKMKYERYVNVRNIVENKKQESKNHNSDFASYNSQLPASLKNLKNFKNFSSAENQKLKTQTSQNLVPQSKFFYLNIFQNLNISFSLYLY